MNILSIGNSYSQDAQRYLHQIAAADGEEINNYNLYIGGCSLARHYRNMLSEKPAYGLGMNGQDVGFPVSLKEALLNREWDVVTVQQASHFSTDYNTYQPYLHKLVEYIRLCAPQAKIYIQQTWAYEQDSARLNEKMGYTDQKDMFNDLKKAYKKAAEEETLDGIIPSGEVFQELLKNGIEKIHRDTFHASLGLGRYALGLIWYKVLTGKDIQENSFCKFDEEVTPAQIALAKKSVEKVYKKYYK
ncbi:MAG: DUF4886 domain-containing protein [Oscillospiraceae bacterium]|nr:DUF4886 domain-containing protein [Oscillospiraceae bacterium]